MSYIDITNDRYPISEQDIRNLFPLMSFSQGAFNPPEEYMWVFPTPQPLYDPISQFVREIAPTVSSKNTWEQQWEVIDLDPEQIAVNIEAKRVAAIPRSVSPRQIKQALTRAGLRQQVEDAVAAGDQDLKDWYAESTDFERMNQHVLDMAVTLGVTERQLDDLFTLAGTL